MARTGIPMTGWYRTCYRCGRRFIMRDYKNHFWRGEANKELLCSYSCSIAYDQKQPIEYKVLSWQPQIVS